MNGIQGVKNKIIEETLYRAKVSSAMNRLKRSLTGYRGQDVDGAPALNRHPVQLVSGILVFFFIFSFAGLPFAAVLRQAGLHALSWIAPFYWYCFGVTVALAAVATSVATLVGSAAAWVMLSLPQRLRFGIRIFLLLPFVAPALLTAIGVERLAQLVSAGALSDVSAGLKLVYGYIVYNVGLVAWLVEVAFSRIPADFLLAARTLGARPFSVFRRLVWPFLKPTVVAAAALVFLFCLSSFGLTLLLADGLYTSLEVEIHRLAMFHLDLKGAATLALLQMTLCSLLLFWQARALRAAKWPDKIPFEGRQLYASATQRFFQIAGLFVLLVTVWAPMGTVLWISLRVEGLWSFQHYLNLRYDEALIGAILNSIQLTALVVIVAIVIGGALATSVRLAQNRWSLGLGQLLMYLPYVLPGTVLSIGYLLLYPSERAILPLLVGATTFLAYPFVAKLLVLAWQHIEPEAVLAARTLGATPARAFFKISWPRLRPALAAGAALAAATAVGEFAVGLFLGRPEWLTLPRLIFERLRLPGRDHLGSACALSTVLLMLTAFFLGISVVAIHRQRVR